MKKSALFILLFVLILMTGNMQAQSSDSIKSKGNNHRGRGWHYKKNFHTRENRSVHRHGHHHGKNSLQTHARFHHGNKMQGEKKTTESNK
ncbi:MAG: hypothetical protein AABY93_04480 [Bacteroidota bacterium]